MKPYYCGKCERKHYPYRGLIYTEHLGYMTSKEALKKAKKMFNEILDSKEPELFLEISKDEFEALKIVFSLFNLPIECKIIDNEVLFEAFGKLIFISLK